MKISVVVTVKNEGKSINRLIDSLLAQTEKADEIIVVDAGSNDETVKRVKQYQRATTIVRSIVVKGGNRSQGRNAGIKAAKNEIIAVTDAGCIPDKNWLKLLLAAFSDKKVMATAGFYRPVTASALGQAISPYLAVMPDKFDAKTYLPSSRSLAFRKGAAWYPEELNYCEDLVFAEKLLAAGKMARVKAAMVDWQISETLADFFEKIKNYASGDIKARFRPHLIKIATVWLRYVVFAFFPPLFLLYLFWPIFKHRRYVPKNARILLPLVQITADAGVIYGSFKELLLLANVIILA